MSPTGFRQKALVGIVVPAGGLDKCRNNWDASLLLIFMYLSMYQLNIDTPPETH